jgi:hypothetical protein
MKIKKYVLLLPLLILAAAGCGNSSKEASPPPAAKTPAPVAAAEITGTVAETMNAANYTYVLLDTGKEKIWFAGPGCAVKAGDKLSLPTGMLKENFTSKTLNRTFEKIYFVESILPKTGSQPVCAITPAQQSTDVSPAVEDGSSHIAAPSPAGADFSGIIKPAGGKTVAEIYADKKNLAGKTVTLRGKVVKYTAEIMGKNWVHVQDGTGTEDSHDLTVTTLGTAKVGDRVLVEGLVSLDKDFGYGYKYPVLIDNATLKAE